MSTEAIIVLHQVRVDLTTLFLHIHMANKKEPLIIKPRLDQLYILAIHKISVTTEKLKAMNNYAYLLILVIAHSYDLS